MSAADGGRSQRHPIEEYLAGLRASLRVAPGQAELIVAEAEDHLRETAAAGVAAGMTELEAQEAAISAFGSVRAVVRAHQAEPGHLVKGRTAAAVLGDLVLAAWKLAGVGLIAVGASGLLVALMNTALGRPFTGQAPAGTRFSKGDCAYWMSLWPGARTCAAAHMLEASSDGVVLRVAAGIAGAGLVGAYAMVRYLQRRRGRAGRPAGRLLPGRGGLRLRRGRPRAGPQPAHRFPGYGRSGRLFERCGDRGRGRGRRRGPGPARAAAPDARVGAPCQGPLSGPGRSRSRARVRNSRSAAFWVPPMAAW